jgi:hypothetical protein
VLRCWLVKNAVTCNLKVKRKKEESKNKLRWCPAAWVQANKETTAFNQVVLSPVSMKR